MQGLLTLLTCATLCRNVHTTDVSATLVEFSVALKGFINAFRIQQYPRGTPIDIVYVVDASGSIGLENFKCGLQALKDVTDIINSKNPITPNGTNIGVVKYATNSRTDLAIGLGQSRDKVFQSIDNVVYTGGELNTEKGLDLARKMLMQSGRAVPQRIILLLTDGKTKSSRNLLDTVALTKKQGIEIFAIPIKNKVSQETIQNIVSEPASVHTVEALDYCTLVKGFAIINNSNP